jgi:hypothetical protein
MILSCFLVAHCSTVSLLVFLSFSVPLYHFPVSCPSVFHCITSCFLVLQCSTVSLLVFLSFSVPTYHFLFSCPSVFHCITSCFHVLQCSTVSLPVLLSFSVPLYHFPSFNPFCLQLPSSYAPFSLFLLTLHPRFHTDKNSVLKLLISIGSPIISVPGSLPYIMYNFSLFILLL